MVSTTLKILQNIFDILFLKYLFSCFYKNIGLLQGYDNFDIFTVSRVFIIINFSYESLKLLEILFRQYCKIGISNKNVK